MLALPLKLLLPLFPGLPTIPPRSAGTEKTEFPVEPFVLGLRRR